MKRLFILLSMFGMVFILNSKSSAEPKPVLSEMDMQFGFFYSSLTPHGEWIQVESGIRVWRPFHLSQRWRPYLVGRWVWTDEYGWYWMSHEPFGWITYHYGRWYNDDYYGWVWMPDDVWGPAWVEWRYDDNYIGWAPLPPYATFHMSFGIRFTTHWNAPARYWNCVPYNRFGSIIRYRDTAPESSVRRFIRTGRSGPQYGIERDRIMNRGVDRAIIERRGNVRFPNTEIRENREQSGERLTRSSGTQRSDRIEIYRPTRDEMVRSTERVEPRRGERNLSIDISKVERPRSETRTSGEEHPQRNEPRTVEPQRDPGLQRENQQPEQMRERPSQLQEPRQQRDTQEKRRELIQRYERKQNPSPPTVRESQQMRTGEGRQNMRSAQPAKPSQERRSESKNERRRSDR
ncbi:MAG: hypothetical protein EHM64_10150 [Ignavibacteriae bacterium]|nr:MAG: hypothetical protein EHM64_10150 [Ignavibacteriota bacterium]